VTDEEPRTSRQARDADGDGPALVLARCRLDGVGPLGVLVTWHPEPWPIWAAWLRRLGPDNWFAWWGTLPADAPQALVEPTP
jgi:hypothetical protein